MALRSNNAVFVAGRRRSAGANVQGRRAGREVVIGRSSVGEKRVGADVTGAGDGLFTVIGGPGVIIPRIVVPAGDAAGRVVVEEPAVLIIGQDIVEDGQNHRAAGVDVEPDEIGVG